MLADDPPRTRSGPWDALHGIGGVGRAVEVLDRRTEVWSCERQPMSCRGPGDSAGG